MCLSLSGVGGMEQRPTKPTLTTAAATAGAQTGCVVESNCFVVSIPYAILKAPGGPTVQLETGASRCSCLQQQIFAGKSAVTLRSLRAAGLLFTPIESSSANGSLAARVHDNSRPCLQSIETGH